MTGDLTFTGPTLLHIHAPEACTGRPCPFHHPSDHHMRTWPLNYRASGLTERLCPHRIGHPDPDSLAWLKTLRGVGVGVHGCDGYCTAREQR